MKIPKRIANSCYLKHRYDIGHEYDIIQTRDYANF